MLQLATPGDREAVAKLRSQVHSLHTLWRPESYFMPQDLYPEEDFLRDIRARQLYIAKLSDIPVGYLKLKIVNREGCGVVDRRIMVLEELAVEETCRRQGIATEMLRDLGALAKAFGCTQLRLSVLPENDGAIALYRKAGFTLRHITMETTL